MNIIEMAIQAGLKLHQEQAPGMDGVVGNWADLEAFAELVAAQEREACAKVCEKPDTNPYDDTLGFFKDLVAVIILAASIGWLSYVLWGKL